MNLKRKLFTARVRERQCGETVAPREPINAVKRNDKGGRDERVHFAQGMAEKAPGKGPDKPDFLGEYSVEITAQGWIGQRIGIDAVEGTPFIVHNLARNVDERKSVQAAGHGTMLVDEAAAVSIQKRTGSFVVIGHECFPLIIGAHIEDEGLIEFGPYQPEDCDALPTTDKNLLAYLRIEPVKAPAQKGRVQERYVEEPPAAVRTAVGTADAVARTVEAGAEPVVDAGEQAAVVVENFFHGPLKRQAGALPPAFSSCFRSRRPLSSQQLGLGKNCPEFVPFLFDILAAPLFTVNQGNDAEYLEPFLFSPLDGFHGRSAGGHNIFHNDHL
jgi:hypothetical protein